MESFSKYKALSVHVMKRYEPLRSQVVIKGQLALKGSQVYGHPGDHVKSIVTPNLGVSLARYKPQFRTQKHRGKLGQEECLPVLRLFWPAVLVS